MIEAIFLDRDGTIGGTDHVVLPGVFQLYDSAIKAIGLLKTHGIRIYAFTNQPSIERRETTYEAFYKELMAFGFDDVFICPHTHESGCLCRKPNSKMLLDAEKKHGLNLKRCVVIGDRWSDLMAGQNVSAKTILVKTGAGKAALTTCTHKWSPEKVDYIANDVLDAVTWLLHEV